MSPQFIPLCGVWFIPVLTFVKLFQPSFSILISLLLYEAYHIFLTQSSLVFSLHVSLLPVYPAAFLNISLQSHSPAKIKKPTPTSQNNQHPPNENKTVQHTTTIFDTWKVSYLLQEMSKSFVCYSRIFKVSPPTYISKLPSSLSIAFALPADH